MSDQDPRPIDGNTTPAPPRRVEILIHPVSGERRTLRRTVTRRKDNNEQYIFENAGTIDGSPALKIAGEWVVYEQKYYDLTTMPMADLFALYQLAERNIAAANDAAQSAGKEITNKATMDVPIAAITLPRAGGLSEWCREKRIDFAHVAEVRCNFDAQHMTQPTIIMRITEDDQRRPIVVVHNADGTHRITCLTERGVTVIEAGVTIVHSEEEEAKAFLIANKTRPTSQQDKVRARLCSNEEKIQDLVRRLNSYGLELATHTGGARYPKIAATGAVEEIDDSYGPAVLRRKCELLVGSGVNWQCGEALQSQMLFGLAGFINQFEVPGYAQRFLVEDMMHQTTPTAVYNQAAGKTAEHLLRDLRKKTTSAGLTSEAGRHDKVTLAFYETYNNLIKSYARNDRPQATAFRTLWKLWHDYNTDTTGADRRSIIEKKQRMLQRQSIPKMIGGVPAVQISTGQPINADLTPVFELPLATDSRNSGRTVTI